MRQLPGERRCLTVQDTVGGTTSEEEFDAVTNCRGLNKQAFTPEVPGQDSVPGSQRGPSPDRGRALLGAPRPGDGAG